MELIIKPGIQALLCNGVSDEYFPQLAPPKLEWCMSRQGKVNAIARIDVRGANAFAVAGLVAWAAPSDMVRLFVFMPHGRSLAQGYPQGAARWRYESWFVVSDSSDHRVTVNKRLLRHIVQASELHTADMVEVFSACELATRLKLREWLGKLA